MFDLVIRNGMVVTPDSVVNADIGVSGTDIAEIDTALPTGRTDVDATGHYVIPGGVDPHCHIEQMSGMGVMNADTFESATRSAALGGTTSVISFAAQEQGQEISDALADYTDRAQRGAMVDHAFHMIVRDTQVPDFADDLKAAINAGHRSIKVFTTYNIKLDDADILTVLDHARASGALVCVHAENDAIIARAKAALIAAGHTAPKHHAASHPPMAEVEAVTRICRFAEYTGAPVMLFHISTAEAAAVVSAARARGAPVWAETCPHYLFMTADILDQPGLEGAKWMCSPPQRGAADQQALWDALQAGDLQMVSSDHAPYRFDATGKLSAGPEPRFDQIANGLPGLETRLPLMFDAMVSKGRGGPVKFAELTAKNPAKIYGLPKKGALASGMHADIVLWDPDKQVTYGENDLHDNVGYNPWVGRTVTGWPTDVWLRGRQIVKAGFFDAQPGSGAWINRPAMGVATQ
ncbi:MAG: dihydropyrimidinase [Pseudomonadota bacterium]